MIITIERKVSLEPKFFDRNINTHILNKLKSTMEGNCYIDLGYVTKIIKLIKILNNIIIPSNSYVVFHIVCKIEVIKPVVGKIITELITRITEDGLFVDIGVEKIRILVPVNSYPENKNFKTGMKISVKIILVKYVNKQYKCMGHIVN